MDSLFIILTSWPAPTFVVGCDCGVYVICNSEALSRQYSAGDMTPVCDGVTQSMVTQKRHDLKELILRLAADKASDDESSDDNTSYDKTSSFPSPDTADLIPEEDLIWYVVRGEEQSVVAT